MMARFTSDYVKREKWIGGSLIALFELASESLGVTAIRLYLLRQAQSSAPGSRGGEQTLAY